MLTAFIFLFLLPSPPPKKHFVPHTRGMEQHHPSTAFCRPTEKKGGKKKKKKTFQRSTLQNSRKSHQRWKNSAQPASYVRFEPKNRRNSTELGTAQPRSGAGWVGSIPCPFPGHAGLRGTAQPRASPGTDSEAPQPLYPRSRE